MSEQMTEAYKRKMRFRIWLPVIIVPFITITFHLLGGGKDSEVNAAGKHYGLNTKLPDARVAADSAKDKMTFYAAAASDSSKRAEALRNDPYRKEKLIENISSQSSVETNIQQVKKLLASREEKPANNYFSQTQQPVTKRVEEKPLQRDPEMEEINNMIDKLSAIQHPAKEPKPPVAKNAITVTPVGNDDDDFFGGRDTVFRKSFLSDDQSGVSLSSTFLASIPVTQILQAGSVVKLQLLQAVKIGSHTLANRSFVFGVASIEGERLQVQISSVRAGDEVVPVALSVYDLDGLEGIYVPGSLSRETIKSTADQALQSVNVLSLDPSIKTQAAMAGVGAVKSILSKKVKAVRATVTAGYRVLLRDNKSN
ncbi:MAG: conjugative transposon protein TraM [Bacteroidota bacterium]